MLLYDHQRTETIVQRLRAAEKILRLAAILAGIVTFGFPAYAVVRISEGSIQGIVAGAFGGLFGYFVGAAFMVLVAATIEWMCQLLVAQGELLEVARRSTQRASGG